MALVSITRLRVRALRYLPAFSFNALRAARQAKAASGNLAVSLLADTNFAFWTRTLWQDQGAMHAFMVSGPHRKMMPRLLEWCDEASVAHWAQESLEIPSWLEVHGRMLAEGRRSKVNHPSDAQQRFEIPLPRPTVPFRAATVVMARAGSESQNRSTSGAHASASPKAVGRYPLA